MRRPIEWLVFVTLAPWRKTGSDFEEPKPRKTKTTMEATTGWAPTIPIAFLFRAMLYGATDLIRGEMG